MQLQETRIPISTMAVGLFKNDQIQYAFAESLSKEFGPQEFEQLDTLFAITNDMLSQPENVSSYYTNVSFLKGRLTTEDKQLPRDFDCSNNKWRINVLRAIQTINYGNYQDPLTINGGEKADIFRFYLLDGAAAWISHACMERRPGNKLEDDANMVVNSLCEAAVFGAELGNAQMHNLVKWMVDMNWIEEKWGFTEPIVVRAKELADLT